jgi:alanyl-tRNA synthetase
MSTGMSWSRWAKTLFTGNGTQPLLPYLLGAPHPSGTWLVDVQPCLRAQDMRCSIADSCATTRPCRHAHAR